MSPSGIVTPPNPSTDAATTISRITDGTVTLTGTISNAACGTRQFTKIITVGAQGASITSLQGSFCSNGYKTWTLTANAANGTNRVWSVDFLGTNSQILIFNPKSPSTLVDVKGGGTVKLNYTDLCGAAKTDGLTVYSNCPPAFTIAPNPAQSDITVSIDAGTGNNTAAAKNAPVSKIYKIKIADRLALVRKLFDYKVPVQSVIISTSGLEAGIYSVSIFDGTVWITQKLIVQ